MTHGRLRLLLTGTIGVAIVLATLPAGAASRTTAHLPPEPGACTVYPPTTPCHLESRYGSVTVAPNIAYPGQTITATFSSTCGTACIKGISWPIVPNGPSTIQGKVISGCGTNDFSCSFKVSQPTSGWARFQVGFGTEQGGALATDPFAVVDDSDHVIDGYVVYPNHSPAENTPIAIRGAKSVTVSTGVTGYYSADGLPAGKYTVTPTGSTAKDLRVRECAGAKGSTGQQSCEIQLERRAQANFIRTVDCPIAKLVSLTSSMPAAVNLSQSPCLVLYATWLAASPGDRQAMISGTKASFLVDGKSVPFTWLRTQVGSTYAATAVWPVFEPTPGTHTASLVLTTTRSIRSTTHEYTVVPAGSDFVAATTINVTGTATGPNDVTPCPATLTPSGLVSGKPPAGDDSCAAWAEDGVELHVNVGDVINPDESLCSATATPVCSTKAAIASVIAVDGPTTVRRSNGQTVPAVPGTPLYLGDEVFTDQGTVAAIEFAAGGRIGINSGSLIRLNGNRQALDSLGNVLQLDSGTLFAKFPRQESPLIFRTRNTTLGIRDGSVSLVNGHN